MSHSCLKRVLYLSHGGGPLPLLGDPAHQMLVHQLENVVKTFSKPSAILVVSAHWEASKPTVTGAARPGLIYDYGGFPEASYHIQYPAPGAPDLAERIFGQLNDCGMDAKLDAHRGWDHGLFVPLKIMYPEADIPCVQLSLVQGLDPTAHIAMGRALAELDQQNLLIVGSGFSFHNLRAFFQPSTDEVTRQNEAFEQWLIDTCSNVQLSETERVQRLVSWQEAPGARFCHPREEHLMPLHVCYGVAQAPANQVFQLDIMGKQASMYLW